MNKGMVYVHLFLIAIAMLIGGFSVWRSGWIKDGENFPNLTVIAMACIVISQFILILSERSKQKNSKNP
jgi:drug/metabolite transporter superfamily protein YnfA